MKKKLILIIAIAVGIVCLCSCTKVSEKTFVGTWRVISCQANDNEGYGWYELMEDGEKRTITFNEDGTYVDNYDDSFDIGTWAYISYSEQLRLFGVLWNIHLYEKKEMELRFDGDDMSERLFLKKI